MDPGSHDESTDDFDSVLSPVSSALTGGESINPFAKPVTAAEGEQ